MSLRSTLAAGLLALAAASPALAADAPGCKDLSGLKRFDGSSIVLCDKKNFAEYNLPTGKATAYDFNNKRGTFDASLDLEGRLASNAYAVPMGASAAEVFRNYKQELAAKGFRTLYEGKQGDLGYWMAKVFEAGLGGQLFGYSPNEARYIAVEKQDGGLKTNLAIYVIEYETGYAPKEKPQKGQVFVRIDEIQSGELKDKMVTVTAEEMAREIEASGAVELRGLLFDFNKATLQPESRSTLDEIAKYLKANPDQKVHVVGHTDSVGGLDFNQKLSQARAATVTAELAKTYGIAAARLRPAGVGLLSPVASNATEDGRAKNRRVELLPQ